MKELPYLIITADTLAVLQKRVNEYITRGYDPCGGVHYKNGYIQAVYMKDVSNIPPSEQYEHLKSHMGLTG